MQAFQNQALSGTSNLRSGTQALLANARDGAFNVAATEALDRSSSDLEDVAGLFKRPRFVGSPISSQRFLQTMPRRHAKSSVA